MMVPIKDRLRILRESQPDEPTQIQIAERLGVKAGTYSSWENGIVPKTEMLIKVAELYHVSLDYVAGLSNEKRPDANLLSVKFAALSDVGNFAPTASDLADMLDAMARYIRSGASCGNIPFESWKGFIMGLTAALNAAASGDTGTLVDQTNAATIAALETTKMPAAFYVQQQEGNVKGAQK